MTERETITIYRRPTPAEITRWAETALRNVPDRSLTRQFMADLLEDFADGLPALVAKGAPDDMAGALIRVRQIALQSEAAPLAMGEIVKRVDMVLGEDTPLPAWMGEMLAEEFAALAEVERLTAEVERLTAEVERLQSALELAVSRGCNHCAESIRVARIEAGIYPRPDAAEAPAEGGAA